jgi:hypothetical protein
MKRIDTATVSADKFGAGKDGFTNGAAPLVPPTELDCTWFDHVQEEIAGFIEDTGGTLNGSSYGQLQDAVVAQIARGDGPVKATGVTTTPASTVDPGTNTVSAERVGSQAAPSAAGLVGDRYTDTEGRVRTCRVAGTPGTFKAVGALQTRQVLTASSGTYTTPAGVVAINVRAWAAGGGGGGASSSTLDRGCSASGGASGGYAEKLISSPNATYAYACGAAGAAGAYGASGGAGGDTTFGSSLVTAKGGGGGSSTGEVGFGSDSFWEVNGGLPATTGGIGDIVAYGVQGGSGKWVTFDPAGGALISGNGASSAVGVGGVGLDSNASTGAGSAATGYAAGGGGAKTFNDEDYTGGAGSPGLIIVDEYY